MDRQWAQAWFNPECNSWCVGFYTSGGTRADSWHTAPNEKAARTEAADYNSAQLTIEYNRWQAANGLTLGSADDVDHDELTAEQSAWIYAFCDRWEANERSYR
jgi:hypothetical protein